MQTLFLPAVLLLSSFIVSLIGLTFYSLWRDEKKKNRTSDFIKSDIQNALENATLQASELLRDARTRSEAILTEAEMAGIKSIATKKIGSVTAEKAYEKNLQDLTEVTVKELSQATSTIKKRYEQFVTESENIIAHHITENQRKLDDHMNSLIETNEKAFGSFVQTQEKRIEQAMNTQIQDIQQLVKLYERKRYELVESKIVELVEEVTRLTLKKTLSLTDQTDLILESLEEAKKEGFFSKEG